MDSTVWTGLVTRRGGEKKVEQQKCMLKRQQRGLGMGMAMAMGARSQAAAAAHRGRNPQAGWRRAIASSSSIGKAHYVSSPAARQSHSSQPYPCLFESLS
jgi:hypothetical protein